MNDLDQRRISMPLGVVIRRRPGVTRWAAWAWQAVAVLPGAPQTRWKELRREGDSVEFHAGTVELSLFRTDSEAYLVNLSDAQPSIYVILRNAPETPEHPFKIVTVTASPYESQDYADNGEDIVEKVPMPPGLFAWVRDYAQHHHTEDAFVKRRRDKKRVDISEDGIGDARISQPADVYRAPASAKKARLN